MSEAFIVRRGGGANSKIVIVVEAPTGSIITCSNGTKTYTTEEADGKWMFTKCKAGVWTIKGELNGASNTETVTIPDDNEIHIYNITLMYRKTPSFTYTGNCKIVDDVDGEISDFATWQGNWKIRFLTSGDLKIDNLYLFDGMIDVFVVGGGGSGGNAYTHSNGENVSNGYGGGGGYWENSTLSVGTQNYKIKIGSGGSGGGDSGNSGGSTSAFSLTVNGGSGGGWGYGGSTGSGGSKTGEFGGTITGTSYSGSGEKGGGNDGLPNTGRGGDGSYQSTGYGPQHRGDGGSGIVIIRNAR